MNSFPMRPHKTGKVYTALVVGEHIVCHGTSNDHQCVVCLKKQQEFLRRNRGVSKKDCPFKDRKTSFKCLKCNVYVCIGRESSNCFYLSKLEYWL